MTSFNSHVFPYPALKVGNAQSQTLNTGGSAALSAKQIYEYVHSYIYCMYTGIQCSAVHIICVYICFMYALSDKPPVTASQNQLFNYIMHTVALGHAVAQWLRHCATNRKVSERFPIVSLQFFIDIILAAALRP
jgi:hypothetical protein